MWAVTTKMNMNTNDDKTPVPTLDMTTINRPEFLEPAPSTPRSSRSASPVCPGAPRRPRPADITIPHIDDHRGKGILPIDFIKPDPALFLKEKRRYIVKELDNWLNGGRIISQVRQIAGAGISDTDIAIHIATGDWPAARIYYITKARSGEDSVGDEISIAKAALYTYKACLELLQDGTLTDDGHLDAKVIAVGLVESDMLSDGNTIKYHWDTSPFEALRNAPPLPDTDSLELSEDEDADESESDEEESESEEVDVPDHLFSVSQRINMERLDLSDIWKAKINVAIDVDVSTVFFILFAVVAWLMLNAYVLNGCRCR
jgi:hypothetical protein